MNLIIQIAILFCWIKDNFIQLIVNGQGENIPILGDNYGDSLPNEIFINNLPVSPAKKVNLSEEGDNIIKLKWESKVVNCYSMFRGCTSLLSVDLSNFDSSSINNVAYMFGSTKLVKFINLTNFNPP